MTVYLKKRLMIKKIHVKKKMALLKIFKIANTIETLVLMTRFTRNYIPVQNYIPISEYFRC